MVKPQRHSSHIDMFFRCAVAFMFRYLMEIISIPTVALHVGSSTHHSVERNLKHKIEFGELLSLEDVQETARDSVNSRWDTEGIALAPDEKAKGEKTVRGQAVDQAVALATIHHEKLAPLIDPVSVEDPWVLEVPNFPVDLAGQWDVREKNGIVRDTKTSRSCPKAVLGYHKPQITVYSLANQKIHGTIPVFAVDYLVKTKQPQAITHTTTCTQTDIDVWVRRWEFMEDCISKGVFSPSRPGVDWWCTPIKCGYWERCEYVG